MTAMPQTAASAVGSRLSATIALPLGPRGEKLVSVVAK